MFILTLSSNKLKKFLSLFCVMLLVLAMGAITFYKCNKKELSAKSNEELAVNNGVSDIKELLQFISNFGWETLQEPDEVREVIIPAEFDDVYKKYNEIQISQGYDLTEYSGQRVKRWTFSIKNYPGYENSEFIKINILVCDNCVIGGDVCSVELNGFMHGFARK